MTYSIKSKVRYAGLVEALNDLRLSRQVPWLLSDQNGQNGFMFSGSKSNRPIQSANHSLTALNSNSNNNMYASLTTAAPHSVRATPKKFKANNLSPCNSMTDTRSWRWK